jgi:hypothetical protein
VLRITLLEALPAPERRGGSVNFNIGVGTVGLKKILAKLTAFGVREI